MNHFRHHVRTWLRILRYSRFRIGQAVPWSLQSWCLSLAVLLLFFGEVVWGIPGEDESRLSNAVRAFFVYGASVCCCGVILHIGVWALSLLGRRQLARMLFFAGFMLFFILMATDAWLTRILGHHVVGILRVAFEKSAGEMAGSLGYIVYTAIRKVALLTLLMTLLVVVVVWVRRRIAPKVKGRWRHLSRMGAAIPLCWVLAAIVVLLTPDAIVPTWSDRYCPLDLHGVFRRSGTVELLKLEDPHPVQQAVGEAWLDSFVARQGVAERLFPEWFDVAMCVDPLLAPRSDSAPLELAESRRKDVIIVVLESWRHETLNKKNMPWLDSLASQGLRLNRHFSNGNETELGMYALLFGRNPLDYMDAWRHGDCPSLISTLKENGYDSLYVAAQPKEWRGMEFFLNHPPFDEAVYYNYGDRWRRDIKAVDHLCEALQKENRPPLCAVLFLDSSHMRYDYPESKERYPVDQDEVSCTLEDRVRLMDMYRNSLAWNDMLLQDKLSPLMDLSKQVWVVTGDHGESFWEDGVYGHCTRLSDAQCHVPFLMVSEGVSPQLVETPTQHTDMLPTLWHALSGEPYVSPQQDGMDLIADVPDAQRPIVLANPREDAFGIVLIRGKHRMKIGGEFGSLHQRALFWVRGFVDEQCQPIEPPAVAHDAEAWRRDSEKVIASLRQRVGTDDSTP